MSCLWFLETKPLVGGERKPVGELTLKAALTDYEEILI